VTRPPTLPDPDDTKADLLSALANPDVELRALDIELGTSRTPNGPIMEHVPNGTTVWTITTYNANADRREAPPA